MRSRLVPRRIAAVVLFTALLARCGGTDFSGTDTHRSTNPDPTGDEDSANAGDDTDTAARRSDRSDTDATAARRTADVDADRNITDLDGKIKACPPNNQRVLIVDMKSGWWAGDGGQFFERVLSGLTTDCNGKVSIEYHHIVLSGIGSLFGIGGGTGDITNSQLTIPGTPGLAPGASDYEHAFTDASLASYQQVWLLSGAANDPMDLPLGHPFLTQFLAALASSKAAVLVGGGFGSIIHANAATQSLGFAGRFTTVQAEGDLLNPMGGVTVLTQMRKGVELVDHVLTSRGITAVADALNVGGTNAASDSLTSLASAVKVVARNAQGQNVIAAGVERGRRVVYEAGLQRYYAIWNGGQSDTLQLLHNIITYLSGS